MSRTELNGLEIRSVGTIFNFGVPIAESSREGLAVRRDQGLVFSRKDMRNLW